MTPYSVLQRKKYIMELLGLGTDRFTSSTWRYCESYPVSCFVMGDVPSDHCFRYPFITAIEVSGNALVTFPEYERATRWWWQQQNKSIRWPVWRLKTGSSKYQVLMAYIQLIGLTHIILHTHTHFSSSQFQRLLGYLISYNVVFHWHFTGVILIIAVISK